MAEPIEDVLIDSLIDSAVPGVIFAEPKFPVRAVMPRVKVKIRIDRMSRHLYDVHRMLNTPTADEALADRNLDDTVIEHRKTFIGLKGFDYSTLGKATFNFIPPESVYDAWKHDYETMQVEMIYGKSLPFDEMVSALRYFNDRINKES